MKKNYSAGFTVVELLVAIAIIGTMVGMLLPAVQSARESSRRLECANHLKQICLALQIHVEKHKCFPPGAVLKPSYPDVNLWYDPWAEAASSKPDMQGTSWMLQILPYIDQMEIYSYWDFSKNVIGNAELARQDVSLFYCPSRRVSIRQGDEEIMFERWTSGGTDYGGCLGRCNGWRNEYSASYMGPPKISHCFLYGSTIFESQKTGIFAPNRSTTPAANRDGMSNTIMIGEMQRLHPEPGASEYDKWNRTSNDGWATAGVATLFDTMLPDSYDGDAGAPGGMNNWFFESAGSEHPHGAHFGMADGSVHFINENIDSKLYALLGSMADSEVAALSQ